MKTDSMRFDGPGLLTELGELTRHAQARAQQRGVPRILIEWLFQFGSELPVSYGRTIHYFDKRAKRRLERAYGREPVRRFADKLSCYLLEKGGTVITAGHRHKRVRRP